MSFRTRRSGPATAERSTDADAAREAALRLLERARRTRSDLTRRLADKGYAAETIATVLERRDAVGLVDDVEIAAAFLAGRSWSRTADWRRLARGLPRTGV